jgi:hypothetical protein
MRVFGFVAAVWLAATVGSTALWGQFNSQIEGTVTDPSGAVIPGATLTLTNLGTGIKATVQTSNTGYYRFQSLPPGKFTLEAAASGFKTSTISDLVLEVGQTRTVNLGLEVGTASITVTVEATAAAVDLSTAKVSSVVEQRQLTELPLLGRNFLSLVALTAGVTGSYNFSDTFGSEQQVNMNAAGMRGEQNGFAVDSGTVTSMVRHGRTNLQPNAESVQEMRVAVNNFSAEAGGDAGANINVVTRSGSNELHGALSWFHTNNKLLSRNVFQNARNPITGRILPVSRRNEVAGSLGGPLIKNRTFLFGSFDRLINRTAATGTSTVETAEFVAFVQQNFPNNKSTYLMKQYPSVVTPVANFKTAGSIAGVDCSKLASPSTAISTPIGMIPCNLNVTGEGVTPVTTNREGYQWNLRGDHMLTDKDRLYVSVFRNADKGQLGSTVRPQFRQWPYPIWNWYGNINETHTFSPNLLNEFQASVVRVHGEIECRECNIPVVNITGMTGFGLGGPTPFIQNNYNYKDNVSWIRGSHTIKGGFQLSKLQSNWKPTAGYQRPAFTFNNIWDFVRDDPFSQSNIGFNPVNGTVYTPDVAERQTTASWFLEDSWKVLPNLTMTLGVRWETYGRVGQATLGNNVVWQGGNDLPSLIANGKNVTKYNILDNADMNNYAPRFSLAWDPTKQGKMSVRFGSGIFYDTLPSQLYGGAHYTPPIYMLITASKQTAPLLPRYEFCASGTNPYGCPRPYGLEGIVGLDSRNGSTFARADITWIDPALRSSYTMSYFLGLQYALTPTMTVEGNYVGNMGRKLYAKYNVNRWVGDLIANNGIIKRLNPSFGEIVFAQSNLGSAYNGANFTLRKRASHGLMYQAAYTFGRAIGYGASFSGGSVTPVDAWNLRTSRGLTDYDVRHKLALSTVYQVPAFGASPWLRRTVGGWQISGVTILQSGTPFSVSCTTSFGAVRDASGRIIGNSGCDYNADGQNNDRPNAPSFAKITDTSNAHYISGLFTRADFPVPGLGQNGNLGRNTYFNPGDATTNLSVAKIFRVPWFVGGDRGADLQLRADAFNAFNRVNLGGVSSTMDSSTFGRVTSAGNGRQFQFALRLSF